MLPHSALLPRSEFSPLGSKRSFLQVYTPPTPEEEGALKILKMDSSPRKIGTPEAPSSKEPKLKMYKGLSDRLTAIATPSQLLKKIRADKIASTQKQWRLSIEGNASRDVDVNPKVNKVNRRPSRVSSIGVDVLKRKFSEKSRENIHESTDDEDGSGQQSLLECPSIASRIASWGSTSKEEDNKENDIEEKQSSHKRRKRNNAPSVGLSSTAEVFVGEDEDALSLDSIYLYNLRILNEMGYHTQPVDASPVREEEKEKQSPRQFGSQGRHLTQPITVTEKEKAQEDVSPTKASSSIQSRLALLKKSGEEGWKKRVSKEASPIAPDLSEVKLRTKSEALKEAPRPTSIADRLSLLEGSQEGWKNKVDEKDVKQFTVEGKMSKIGRNVDSPLAAKRFNTPKMPLCRDSEPCDSSPTSPTRPSISKNSGSPPKPLMSPKSPSKSMPELNEEVKKTEKEEQKDENENEGKVVLVPVADNDDFRSFYAQSKIDLAEASEKKVEVSLDDLNDIFLDAGDILTSAKRIKPTKRKAASSRNPLRRLQERQDLQQGYTEVSTGVAEKEVRRLKKEQISGNTTFAQEALAGLASKENFSKVALKKADSFKGEKYAPYKDVMLLQVKGRRHCQTRLVEACPESINSGDCFILASKDKLFIWIGSFCNVIERAKVAEVASQIHQKKDLGVKCSRDPVLIDESKHQTNAAFWELLGGEKPYPGSGPSEEDEIYEDCMNITNMVYRLYEDELDPVEEYWGKPLRYEMLDDKEALIFDFGSEMYMWAGKKCPLDKRRKVLKLAEELWKTGYDYSECDVNPLCPLATDDSSGKLPVKSEKRPDWCIFGKVTRNMETVLFREKFINWPDTNRLIKSAPRVKKMSTGVEDLKPVDGLTMVPVHPGPVSLILECSNVGRGRLWLEDLDGLHRKWEISTLELGVWHIMEYDRLEVPRQSYGQFHEGDSYVIRWKYKVAQTGMKTLKGQESTHATVGRERCAYFFWQGRFSSVTEKGASALMTIELDEEQGPQVRVIQGKEPPAFLQLFDGSMIIHRGKREDGSSNTQGTWRCYIVRNELPHESCLLEVTPSSASLRSRASLLILNINTCMLYIWHGSKASSQCRDRSKEIAQSLRKHCPMEISMHEQSSIIITELEEGEEKKEFWVAMDTLRDDRSLYNTLLDDPLPFDYSPRLFHMVSVSGVFEAKEILNPCRNHEDVVSAFPFMQTDLYNASQPALFLVDVGHCVYLWQGWWPEENEEEENIQTGSAEGRFTMSRMCAMQTTLSYCKERSPSNPVPAFLVHAGVEPLEFINSFPMWEKHDDVRQLNLTEGRQDGEVTSVEELMSKILKTRYTWEELQEHPLPEGVDPLRLEQYLEDEEFEDIMGMTREEFSALPAWKQLNLKKEVDLY